MLKYEKIIMETAMDELKAFLSSDENDAFQDETDKQKKQDGATAKKKSSATDARNIELAKIYEDAAEYEEEIETFEKELEFIKSNSMEDIDERFGQELKEILEKADSQKDTKSILIERWEMLISIKKEHLKEEIADIKIAGLKPSFVKRIYKQVHGITK